MKKFILTSLVILFTITVSFSQTFGIGGVHRGGTSPAMKQRMKDKLKAEFKLTDEQAGAVTVIQQDYELKARAIKIDTKTNNKEKEVLLAPVEEERKQSLKKILSDEQIDKLDEYIKNGNLRRQRQA